MPNNTQARARRQTAINRRKIDQLPRKVEEHTARRLRQIARQRGLL